MTVLDIEKDTESRTITITAEFDAPVERVWQVWADPRQLERWWGPPTYPATVVEHDLRPGGTVTYLMTGPDGDQPKGYWRVVSVDAPRQLEFEDGFAEEDWTPNPELPVTVSRVTLDEVDGRTRMVIRSSHASVEDMERLVAMGMVEGITGAMAQIDDLLVAA